MNRIYFFANFGDWKKQPYGGGEIGNRRTLALLYNFKFKTIVIEKYKRVPNHSVLNLILLVGKMGCNIIRFMIKLSFGYRKDSLVHIVGFYGPMIYFEYVLVSIAYALKYRIIYEMRGGGAELYYKDGSNRYRKTFRNLINKSECIFSQGKENYALIQSLTPDKRIFYYPNYVTDDFMPETYPSKSNKRINFLYFGRVSKTKHVDLVIDIFKNIAQQYDNVYLDIAGNCPEPEYAESIQKQIIDSGVADKIKMRPACDHNELKVILSDKHFYLFPTEEPHEGHSNALTEAMAWGVVPIATAQGFNKSVIGDERLVTHELSVDSFTSVIMWILDNNLVNELSRFVYQRVRDNFTEKVVGRRLEKEYEWLLRHLH